jgi:hypothetical protein
VLTTLSICRHGPGLKQIANLFPITVFLILFQQMQNLKNLIALLLIASVAVASLPVVKRDANIADHSNSATDDASATRTIKS